ncbi:MAG: hypothetical protein EXS01_04455 [Phycisphaerales bacterium]|nr:hypothetical protein [Phycisphaerales bacterium]
MRDPLDHLRDLQKWRGAALGSRGASVPSDSIRGEVTRFRGGLDRRIERFGNAAEVWDRLIPQVIRDDTRLSGLSGGVLTVVTGSAATSFTLDRLLRSGIDNQILTGTGGKITRIRLRVGKVSE